MEAIASEAGVSKLTLYSHFKDKEALFSAAVKTTCETRLPRRLFQLEADCDIEKVLLVNQDGDVTIGAPYVEGARVVVKIELEGKSKKIIVFKYKPKVRYRRKKGHRQRFARIIIEGIELGTKPKAEATEVA